MTQNFEGWLGHNPESADGNMKWGTFEPKKWTEDDVDIKITHCGICGTDIHVLRSDWGTSYPCCVGHEIIGNAVRVGKNVKKINVGDRVGVGPQAWSCDQPDCEECSSGRSNYCSRAVSTYNSSFPNDEGKSYGGFSTYHRTNGRFVVKIPDGVASEDAAPMLCAGVTLYAPLKKHGCGPGKKIGIVGLGGLGHFGVLFSKALEADKVVAISRSSSKRDDAIALGADEYIATAEDSEWATKHAGSLDMVVVTASATNLPVNDYLKLLKVGGTLLQLGADSTAEFPAFSVMTLLYRGLTIVGAIVGTPAETEEMLELAARKHIKPWIQTMPMKDANQAILDVDAGKPRYRIVLTA